jgi:hypothetical protein
MNRHLRHPLRTAVTTALLAILMLSPALPAATAAPPTATPSAVFARESYWEGFADFWTSRLKRQDGIVMFALGVGAVSLFIITRGKWKK